MRSKKTWLLNSEGNVFMILSATVLLLLSASFWLLKQQKITTAISIASTDLSALQHMKPIVVKATKPAAHGDTGGLKNSNWFATIQKEMSKSEYFIREDASSGTLGSPNRKNNLRFTYDANGFSVKPRATKIPLEENKPGQDPDDIKYKTIKDWAIRFDLNNSQWGDGYWKIANNKAEYITDKVTVQYDNQEEGMRQNFVVHTPLEKGKSLAIDFKVSTTLKVTTNKEALNFGLNGEQVMQYKDLKVWDANGKSLTASLQYNGKEAYSIEVDDSKAVYPVTIDPISTAAATLIESTQEGAQLGYSVSGAGDVNGDGYSDVIVGSPNYYMGQTNDGAAFVYHGSASGINTTAASRLESNQGGGTNFGSSVSGAGDVNGDGYSDVIVGANNYENGQTNEGA
ncbi:MAG: integrin alpha, partial [Chitinophagaceae bacterium]|nr:integrin alpha [Chitinophagaceae bacterium]